VGAVKDWDGYDGVPDWASLDHIWAKDISKMEKDRATSKIGKVEAAVKACRGSPTSFGWKEEDSQWYQRWAEKISTVESFADVHKKEPYHRQLDTQPAAKALPAWELPKPNSDQQPSIAPLQVHVPSTTNADTLEPIFHTKLDGTTYSRSNREAALAQARDASQVQQQQSLDQLCCQVCNSAEDGDNLHLLVCDYELAHGKDAVGYHLECLSSMNGVPEGAVAACVPCIAAATLGVVCR
jgi:hypothetical protein